MPKMTRAFSFSELGYVGPVFPAKAGIHITVAYGNLLVARLYGFPPARERREQDYMVSRLRGKDENKTIWFPVCAGKTRTRLYGFPPARERREQDCMVSRLRGKDEKMKWPWRTEGLTC